MLFKSFDVTTASEYLTACLAARLLGRKSTRSVSSGWHAGTAGDSKKHEKENISRIFNWCGRDTRNLEVG